MSDKHQKHYFNSVDYIIKKRSLQEIVHTIYFNHGYNALSLRGYNMADIVAGVAGYPHFSLEDAEAASLTDADVIKTYENLMIQAGKISEDERVSDGPILGRIKELLIEAHNRKSLLSSTFKSNGAGLIVRAAYITDFRQKFDSNLVNKVRTNKDFELRLAWAIRSCINRNVDEGQSMVHPVNAGRLADLMDSVIKSLENGDLNAVDRKIAEFTPWKGAAEAKKVLTQKVEIEKPKRDEKGKRIPAAASAKPEPAPRVVMPAHLNVDENTLSPQLRFLRKQFLDKIEAQELEDKKNKND